MTYGLRTPVALVVLAAVWLVGCGSSSPTTPTPPVSGKVELTTNLPDVATLVVISCVDEELNVWSCTRDLQMSFSVVLNRDLDRARLGIQFLTATGVLCAAANTDVVALRAGTPATVSASAVYVSLQGSSTPPECGLPVLTTRLVASLYQEMGPAGDVLSQAYPKEYTFTER
jgi:hypothetical protein